MILLNPIWLLLGLAAIPILLLHAQRPRRQVVPSLAIWRTLTSTSAAPRNIAWPRLTPSLLLQLAALAAITLAAANLRIVPDDFPDHTVLVIDNSGSMSVGDGIAQSDAGEIISVLEGAGTGLLSVISVEGRARLVSARRDDAMTALRDLSDLSATDQRADWAGVARWLDTIVEDDERTRVHILSSESWRLLDHYQPGDLVSVSATAYPADERGLGLRVDDLSFDRSTQRWRVQGHLRARSADTMPDSVSFYYARAGDADFLDWGAVAPVGSETIDGIQTARFAASLDLPGEGRLVIDAAPGSENASHRHHAVIETARAQVLVVGEPVPEIARALRAATEVDISESESLPEDASAYDLVVLDGPRPQTPPNTNVLYLGASAIDRNQQPGQIADDVLSGWNADHPLSWDIDWASIPSLAYVEGGLPPGLVIVAQVAGNPLLATRTTAIGREVYLSARFAGESWVQDPAFPLLVANIVEWMQIGSATTCISGLACPLDREQRTAQITSPSGEIVYDGSRLSGNGAVLDAVFRPRQAGFYLAGDAPIAVNAAVSLPGENPGEDIEQWWPDASIELRVWLIGLAIALLVAELAIYLAGRRLVGRGVLDLMSRHRFTIAARGLTILTLGAALPPLAVPILAPTATRVIVVDAANAAPRADRDGVLVSANAPYNEGVLPLSWARAVELGLALAPLPPRVALGGDVTDDGALAERLFAQAGPIIDILPVAPSAGSDVSMVSIDAPAGVAMGETFRVTGLVHSDRPGEVRLITLRNGLPVDSRQLELVAGLTRADVVLTPGSVGAELVEMVLESSDDDITANNIEATLVTVGPSPRTLVVARDGDQGGAFRAIVANQGLEVETVAPNAAPRAMEGWLAYDQIVLLDVGARDLRFDQLEQLQTAVGTFGKGLMIAGDENAFGAGGYYGTPLEALSPLSSRVPHDRPQTAIIFVMDRSGSMEAPVGPVTRLDIAKAALANAADLMEPDDLIGIIGFDDLPQTIVSLQERGEDDIGPLLENVIPGGGTALFEALGEAIGVLEAADASLSHIVVITDGLVEPLDFSVLLDRARASEITISTVAAGSSAVTDRLERIAEDGGGVYYATRDFQTLPAIMMQDIMTLDDPVVVDEPTEVAVAVDGRRLGLNLVDLPLLDRHVKTTAKPDAQLMLTLVDAEGETQPLAANWRYGAGSVTAFAMNPVSEVAGPWSALDGFARLWSQSVRDIGPDIVGPGIDIRANRQGEGFDIWSEITGVEGEAVALDKLEVSVAETGVPVEMVEFGSGRYFGRIDQAPIGPTTLLARGGDIESQVTVFKAYPAHLRHQFGDPREPELLAQASGGVVLARDAALPAIDRHWVLRSLAWPWLVVALGVFLIDIFVLRRRWTSQPIGYRRH
ncbi:vWA domain-containing protein [Pelagibacterium luteolum]|uniref:Aerotolerance regulator N-terminal n=1 Tax=Pelagibacterium luteolum TaxID=440168 RepID=A0A1G7UMN5_9HYPH|nr:VWA domain-containing protein [Pelagibacterium luteolum]SDG48369.1 Aerotolerance regulator N-terminal [Pelagibacterium luteolum]